MVNMCFYTLTKNLSTDLYKNLNGPPCSTGLSKKIILIDDKFINSNWEFGYKNIISLCMNL